MKLALDPQMFFSTISVYGLPDIVARLGYDWMELSPKADFIPFFKYPRVDDAGVRKLKKVAFSIVNTDSDRKVAGSVMRGGTIPQLVMFTRNAEGKWDRQQLTGAQSEQAVEQLISEAVTRQAKVESVTKQASTRK